MKILVVYLVFSGHEYRLCITKYDFIYGCEVF
jgi:hypothetical protein